MGCRHAHAPGSYLELTDPASAGFDCRGGRGRGKGKSSNEARFAPSPQRVERLADMRLRARPNVDVAIGNYTPAYKGSDPGWHNILQQACRLSTSTTLQW
jgi:hypothetical protein